MGNIQACAGTIVPFHFYFCSLLSQGQYRYNIKMPGESGTLFLI
jgi:hypothetical protein